MTRDQLIEEIVQEARKRKLMQKAGHFPVGYLSDDNFLRAALLRMSDASMDAVKVEEGSMSLGNEDIERGWRRAKVMQKGKRRAFEGVNYNHISHTHCWKQKQPSACGIPLEKHTQCCLCDYQFLNEPRRTNRESKYSISSA